MTLITLRKIILPLIGLAVVALLYLRGDNLVAWEPGSRATFWVLTSTAVGVFWYAVLTYQLLRAGYTPILTATYRDNQTVIRNNGKGAALNGTLTSHEGDSRLTLGDILPGDERAFTQNVGWDLTSSYYLFYQDVFGRWYATKSLAHIVSNAANFPITNAFQGRIFNPPAESAHQASTQSLLEYVLQVGHWWSPRNWFRWLKAYVKKRWIAIGIMRTARQAVKKLLGDNRLVFTPQPDRSWTFAGRASIGRLLQGIVLPWVWRPWCRPVGTRLPAGSGRSMACGGPLEHLPLIPRSRTVFPHEAASNARDGQESE